MTTWKDKVDNNGEKSDFAYDLHELQEVWMHLPVHSYVPTGIRKDMFTCSWVTKTAETK